MTELEARLAGKIPGEDTGIEVKKTFCAICAPMFHCGIDAYVKDGKVIQEESELEGIFSNLTKNKPVVVFTTTGTKASVIWFSLDMLGYDAKMYTYRDWQKAEREERRQLEEMNRSK